MITFSVVADAWQLQYNHQNNILYRAEPHISKTLLLP